ncbi:hypothetical protein VMCG_04498 [Cytospora schulzeri]|uniref:Uncharacterized protein n=1 Tax=Cytospora schulzeri TaxID=448051 RepID=A0A423WRU1_9PEZI|nr:hypothetical protein VMCG_04498 [Valsa malicola]
MCEVNTQRAIRGPKKGHLKALRNRVAILESRLAEQQQRQGQRAVFGAPASASSGYGSTIAVSSPTELAEVSTHSPSVSPLATTASASADGREASLPAIFSAPQSTADTASSSGPSAAAAVPGLATHPGTQITSFILAPELAESTQTEL